MTPETAGGAWRRLKLPANFWTPARAMVASYLLAIAVGAVMLTLPAAGRDGRISFLDALFTSTSAVCVTGLAVVDTPTAYSRGGHWTVMLLIQLGGLGILTFSTWILIVARQPLGEFNRESAGYGTLSGLPVRLVLAGVFIFTLLIEAAGWLALQWCWEARLGEDAAFQSLFHSISAFCNAGFSTLDEGLLPYRGHWGVNLSISGLVILGGIGFIVMDDVWLVLMRKRKRLTLHSRVALQMTAMLLVTGTVIFLALEWNHSLKGLGAGEMVLASFFQSMTTRTAGFNTVDFGQIVSSTLLIMMLLMVVGASPGSTGGGIKTTTLAILFALLRSQAYGRKDVELKNRAIPNADVARALTTVSLYVLALIVMFAALLLVESWGKPAGWGQARFLRLAFEAVSALGTVGLSLGATPELTPVGKLIIITMMLCGRLGPLVAVLAVVGRRPQSKRAFAEESLLTG